LGPQIQYCAVAYIKGNSIQPCILKWLYQ